MCKLKAEIQKTNWDQTLCTLNRSFNIEFIYQAETVNIKFSTN